MGENVTAFDTLAPLMDIEPDDSETEYPDTLLVAYEYVPVGAVNVIMFVDEEKDCPVDKLTYHVVAEGRLDSVKLTV